MKRIRNLFERLTSTGTKRYCSCGHAVSVNLPVCPFCGQRLTYLSDKPAD